jgi:hypothetical protein
MFSTGESKFMLKPSYTASLPDQKLIGFPEKNCDMFCLSASARCNQKPEVEHESFRSRQPVHGLSQDEFPKKIRSGPMARFYQNSGITFLIET